MKWNILISALLASSIGTNTFALEIVDGKLLGHKEWATNDKIQFSFKEVIKKNNKIENISTLIKKKLGATQETIYASNQIDGEELKDNTQTIFSSSSIDLYNYSNVKQIYSIETQLCRIIVWQHKETEYECASAEDQITLFPQGTASYLSNPKIILAKIPSDASIVGEIAGILNKIYRDGTPVFITYNSREISAQ